jgi:hypothetical protein
LKCLEISTETKSILFATYLVLARWSPMISISFFLPSDLYERFFSCRLSYSRARAVHVHVSIVLFLVRSTISRILELGSHGKERHCERLENQSRRRV